MIESPCVGICRLDPASGLCMGCYRAIDEIAGWGGRSDAEKAAVLDRLPSRRAEFGPRFGFIAGAWPSAGGPTASDRCVKCGAAFNCGMSAEGPCWCTSFPSVKPSPALAAGCLCPDCLADAARRAAETDRKSAG